MGIMDTKVETTIMGYMGFRVEETGRLKLGCYKGTLNNSP